MLNCLSVVCDYVRASSISPRLSRSLLLWLSLLAAFSAMPVSAYDLKLSTLPSRANSVLLNQQTLSGGVYVFVSPDSGLSQVRFRIDGFEVQVENNAPWDLGGTATNGDALVFDTSGLSNGSHQMEARLSLSSGGNQSLLATFSVSNSNKKLQASRSAISLQSPDHNAVSVPLTISDSQGLKVAVSLSSDQSWLQVSPSSATTPASLTVTASPGSLANGTYTANLVANASGYTALKVPVRLRVSDEAAQLHVGWNQSPASSLNFIWFASANLETPQLRYRQNGSSSWINRASSLRFSNADGPYRETTLTGLSANSLYQYQVEIASGRWSKTYSVRTAPGAGPQNFSVIYVADTGLIGRTDGLTTGTAQVISAIADQHPGLVLLGGDYIYFDTDKRYGTLERSIDAWFEQMRSIVTVIPTMPTYGNHEVLLGEGFDSWVRRFASPSGWNNRRMYSFDVGDIHFVSVHGILETMSIPSDGMTWLTNDLQAARNAGKRWIIPFFHAAPFSDGTNHPSATLLRAQLGPLFEAMDVKLVLTAHDQSFERTYPLRNVPATNSPTTTALTCYGMDEGVTWLKAGPGGKLSNISGDFSPWAHSTAPAWTAKRNNTAHHFTRLDFSQAGDLLVTVYGLLGDGKPPYVEDQFRYTSGSCTSEFAVTPKRLDFQLTANQSSSKDLTFSYGSSNQSFTLGSLPSWLSASATSGTTPKTIQITASALNLAPGTYSTNLAAHSGSQNLSIPITLTLVSDQYQALVANNPQRLNPLALDGTTLTGDVYVFVQPEANVKQVQFFLDNPAMSGTPTQVENLAPFDLGGTNADFSAMAFHTNSLNEGSHSLSTRVNFTTGSSVVLFDTFNVANQSAQLQLTPSNLNLTVQLPQTQVSGDLKLAWSNAQPDTFTASTNASWLSVSPSVGNIPANLHLVADASSLSAGVHSAKVTVNSGDGHTAQAQVTLNVLAASTSGYQLKVSHNEQRTNAVSLAGTTQSGNIYVFLSPESGVSSVRFYLDDPNRVKAPIKIESNAPWDFAGTSLTADRWALPFNVNNLSLGAHQITAQVFKSSGGSDILQVQFMVTH